MRGLILFSINQGVLMSNVCYLAVILIFLVVTWWLLLITYWLLLVTGWLLMVSTRYHLLLLVLFPVLVWMGNIYSWLCPSQCWTSGKWNCHKKNKQSSSIKLAKAVTPRGSSYADELEVIKLGTSFPVKDIRNAVNLFIHSDSQSAIQSVMGPNRESYYSVAIRGIISNLIESS